MEEEKEANSIEDLEEFSEYNIKTFSIKDKSLKQLGELLANETSRSIIILLSEEELYVNQIAEKLNMRVSLVIHHLQKLEALGIMDIVEKPITRKTKNHRFFKMRTNIFLEFLEDKKIKKVLKKGLQIAMVGIVMMFMWTQTQRNPNSEGDEFNYGPEFDVPFYEQTAFFPMLFIIIVLSIFLIKKRKKIEF